MRGDVVRVRQRSFYGATYRDFTSALYTYVRREAFGDDIGQTGLLSAEEQDLFIAWLELSPSRFTLPHAGHVKAALFPAQS
jgi:hypothetical protein